MAPEYSGNLIQPRIARTTSFTGRKVGDGSDEEKKWKRHKKSTRTPSKTRSSVLFPEMKERKGYKRKRTERRE